MRRCSLEKVSYSVFSDSAKMLKHRYSPVIKRNKKKAVLYIPVIAFVWMFLVFADFVHYDEDFHSDIISALDEVLN